MKSDQSIGVGSSAASTLYDVAREAGVSTATVSRVVHGQDRVWLSTRWHVGRNSITGAMLRSRGPGDLIGSRQAYFFRLEHRFQLPQHIAG
jgi:hypothetical protein